MNEDILNQEAENITDSAPAEETHTSLPESYEESEPQTDEVDYSAIVREDILTLREKFSECGRGLNDIGDLKNPHRFAALRDLGLSAEEAYLATGGLKDAYDTRGHLASAVPAMTRRGMEIPQKEYEIARGLFSDMSDADIKRLYRKVTK